MKDLEYFREFLEHPESFVHGDFHTMLVEWAAYVKAHKEDFDYLNDEEWREIRERIVADLHKRETIPKKVIKEFESLYSEEIETLSGDEYVERLLEVLKRELSFMKKYQAEFRFPDREIAQAEEDLKACLKEYEKQKAAEQKAKQDEINLQNAIRNYEKNDANKPNPLIVPFKADKKDSRN